MNGWPLRYFPDPEYCVPLQSTEIYLHGLYKYTGERNKSDTSNGIGEVLDEFEA